MPYTKLTAMQDCGIQLMEMRLPENLAARLQAIAAQQQRSPEAVLEQLLEAYEAQIQLHASRETGTFAALAQSALETDIRPSTPTDTASRRSRRAG